jgi:hypothetical protein
MWASQPTAHPSIPEKVPKFPAAVPLAPRCLTRSVPGTPPCSEPGLSSPHHTPCLGPEKERWSLSSGARAAPIMLPPYLLLGPQLVSPSAQLVSILVPLFLPGRAISVAWLWPVLITFAALSLSLQSQASSEAFSACRCSLEWPQWPPQEPYELRQQFRVRSLKQQPCCLLDATLVVLYFLTYLISSSTDLSSILLSNILSLFQLSQASWPYPRNGGSTISFWQGPAQCPLLFPWLPLLQLPLASHAYLL